MWAAYALTERLKIIFTISDSNKNIFHVAKSILSI